MAWIIEFSGSAKREFTKLDRKNAERIAEFLRGTLASADDARRWGKPLKGKLADYWSYRVGDFRLICTIEDDKLTIVVVRIGNRRDVYR